MLAAFGMQPAASALPAGPAQSADTTQTILVLGDSLSAAYQIDPARGWVNLLAERLRNESSDYRVINASISGDTSHGGLSRLPAALQRHQPDIVILELGANDGLRGLPLKDLRQNLAQMIQLAQAAGARVLLLGMKLPPNYGPAYTQGFAAIYQSLAEEYGTGLVPFLLQDIALQRDLMQADNLHPTSEAQPLIVDTVWPQLTRLLH